MDERLRELFGIRTLHEWWPLDPAEYAECDGFRGTLWSEEIEAVTGAEGAVVVSRYKGGELDGLPAVLHRDRAWYVSTLPEPAALRELLRGVAADAGVRPVLEGLPAQVEAVRRGDLLFVLNHGRDPVTVTVPGEYQDLLGERRVTGTLELGRYGVAALFPRAREPRQPSSSGGLDFVTDNLTVSSG
jgi:beta-galactosidase